MDIRPVDAEPDRRGARGRRCAARAARRPRGMAASAASRRDAHCRTSAAATRGRAPSAAAGAPGVQSRVGWISEGGLDYVCERLNVPPADAWGVATFYALLSTVAAAATRRSTSATTSPAGAAARTVSSPSSSATSGRASASRAATGSHVTIGDGCGLDAVAVSGPVRSGAGGARHRRGRAAARAADRTTSTRRSARNLWPAT